MRISICIVTYRRPRGLERLLRALNDLTFPKRSVPDIEIIVVDNDALASGCRVCEALREGVRWRLRWCVEARRGIPQARNRALAEASSADFVAFLDDDEVPCPIWLDELLSVQSEYGADVVAGPVLSSFEHEPPEWVVRGRFFERRRYRTGAEIKYVGTGNVLFRGALFRDRKQPFDPRFALTGGSDTHLSVRLFREGFRMIWADDAEVFEWVADTRVSGRWLLEREFRKGNTLGLVERDVEGSARVFAARLAKALGSVAIGTILFVVSWWQGKANRVRSLQQVCRGMGMIVGVSGFRYQEYRRIHGA